MEQYDRLTDRQKEMVNKFIEENIDSVYDECRLLGTCIYNDEITDNEDIKDECDGSTFKGYYCNYCGKYAVEGFDDDRLISHVIEDLKENYCTIYPVCTECKHLPRSIFVINNSECDECNEENDFKNYESEE